MNYEGFTQHVRNSFEKIARENAIEGEVVIRDIVKNNNINLKAISVMEKNNSATPTIYLETFYAEYLEGRSVRDIVQDIFELYQKNTGRLKFELEDFLNYSFVKDKIAFKVINYEMNKEMLKKIPYIRKLDLAIVFYILLDEKDNNSATAIISKEHLGMWNINQAELAEVAFENTPIIMKPSIRKMEDIIAEMIMGDISEDIESGNVISESGLADGTYGCSYIDDNDDYGNYDTQQIENFVKEEINNIKNEDEVEMYVLTNSKKINGAATMFYDGVLKAFADGIDSDLIIIPSSIHEVILIPHNDKITENEINQMIREVNEAEVAPVEVLAQHLYLYKRFDDKIYM